MPLIKEGRDLFMIEKPDGRLKKFDVPLYKRDTGQYVMHRIIFDKICDGDKATLLATIFKVLCGKTRES